MHSQSIGFEPMLNKRRPAKHEGRVLPARLLAFAFAANVDGRTGWASLERANDAMHKFSPQWVLGRAFKRAAQADLDTPFSISTAEKSLSRLEHYGMTVPYWLLLRALYEFGGNRPVRLICWFPT